MKRFLGILLTLTALLLCAGCAAKEDTADTLPEAAAETVRAICVDGTVYYDTGAAAQPLQGGLFIGVITSTCAADAIPSEHQQSNFGTGYQYQADDAGRIRVRLADGSCVLFAAEEAEDTQEMCTGVPLAPEGFAKP